MIIDYIFSTCIQRDAEIWVTSSRKILEHIKALNYVVVVPDSELIYFKNITPFEFKVVGESEILSSYKLNLPDQIKHRTGWYLQQIIKIQLLKNLKSTEIGVIWDSDTVPLQDLNFISNDNKLIYRFGVHLPKIHQPYFDLIKKVLKIENHILESFISQCFPAKGEWVHAFCDHIEKLNNKNWCEAIIDFVSENIHESGFSEYETLGNFFVSRYSHEMEFKKGEYFRPANYFGKPADYLLAPLNKFANTLEYVAFDTYDIKSCTGLNIGCGNVKIFNSFDGNGCVNIDINETTATDLVLNLESGLPFNNGHFTHIIAHNVLEHVKDLFSTIIELNRLLAIGGVLQIEVPHLGSYNHGTDITHVRGLTFDSFNFLLEDVNYLFTRGATPFNYRLISFNREIIIDGNITREYLDYIPQKNTYTDWLAAVYKFEIPGTFGFVFQKIR